jgi:hypothetical protein
VCGSCGTFLDAAHIKEFPQLSGTENCKNEPVERDSESGRGKIRTGAVLK